MAFSQSLVVLLLLLVSLHDTSADKMVRSLDSNVCSLPAETGPCRAYFPRYYFNSQTGQCDDFVYGGCGGNDNRFKSEEDCQATCAPAQAMKKVVRSVDPSVCSLPSDSGQCLAYFQLFFFNAQSGQCEQFVYGGCGGNDNRFNTLQDCQAACGSAVNRCSLPAQQGKCEAYIPSFFFDSKTGQCTEFVYGGCGGNANRFPTPQECQAACSAF